MTTIDTIYNILSQSSGMGHAMCRRDAAEIYTRVVKPLEVQADGPLTLREALLAKSLTEEVGKLQAERDAWKELAEAESRLVGKLQTRIEVGYDPGRLYFDVVRTKNACARARARVEEVCKK